MPTQDMHPYNNMKPEDAQTEPQAGEEMTAPENAAQDIPDATTETPQQSDAEALENAKKELEDMRLRMAAEMDNFKKRLNREHQEQIRYASEKVLSDLLPALDNLDLALQYGTHNEACKDLLQGIEMTRKQLLDAVGKSGLTSVGEPGEAFDPAKHEAIGMEANPEVEPGGVSRVLQRGYKLNDRILRPAKVMVNN